MKRIVWMILAASLACNAQAASKTDFAFGYTLEVDGDGAIYSVDLPEEVYRGLTRADRGDLRVFNSRGEAVPHTLRHAEQPGKQALPEVKLPVFPLYMESGAVPVPEGYNVHITTNEQGAIIDLNYGKGTPQTRRLSGYIIDASQLEHLPNALSVTWPAEQGDFVATLKLERSDDLTAWHSLVERATLSNLHYGAHALIQQRIDLPTAKYKYLRLSWQASAPFELAEVQAQFPERDTQQERKWTSFAMTDIDNKEHYYYFDTHAVLPVDRINLALPQRNTLTRVRIDSASDHQGPWTPRYNGLVYNLQVDGNALTTPDVWLGPTTHRHWRVQVLGNGGQLDGATQLRLGWVGEQLLFMAQGEAPFVLAYGSGRVERVDTPLPQLLGSEEVRQLQLIKAAQLGSRIELGDKSRLETPRPPTDWKRYSLWSVLVLGVILLAWMALRLYREMENKSD